MPINHKSKLTIAAHRGDCYNYPENTMAAFLASYEAGAEMIETDVHLSKDLIPVLIHDHTLERTTDGKGKVGDYTLDELLQFNAGIVNFPERIPVFEDFMAWISKTELTLNIEIKEYFDEGNVERAKLCIDKVLEIVEKYGMADRILINSFDARALEYTYKKYGKKYMLHGFYPYTIMNTTGCECNPDDYLYCACIFDMRNKPLYDYLIERGIEPWVGAGITTKMHLELAISYGAKLITTNNPADVIRKLKEIK